MKVIVRLQFPILIGVYFISIKRIIRGIEKLSLSKQCIIHQIFLGKIERRNLTRKFSHNAMWNFSYFYLTFFSASLLSVISKFIRDYSLEVWNDLLFYCLIGFCTSQKPKETSDLKSLTKFMRLLGFSEYLNFK